MSQNSPFHTGEIAVQRQAGVTEIANKVGRGIGDSFPPIAIEWTRQQRLIAVGGADKNGAVWATALIGEPGFLRVIGEHQLHVAAVPAASDPVRAILEAGDAVGAIVLEPIARRRLRCNGVASLVEDGWEIEAREVYANCPKYIQPREVTAAGVVAVGGEEIRGEELLRSQREWIQAADTFFMATVHGDAGADCSHRGGAPGFVQVQGNELWWEDFPGNAMFNTLGNLRANPVCGLVFLDWERGGMLQLSGNAEVVWEGTERSVRMMVREWREAAVI